MGLRVLDSMYFFFLLGLQESNFSEFIGTANQTGLVKTVKEAVYWWASASFHWHFQLFYLPLFVPLP